MNNEKTINIFPIAAILLFGLLLAGVAFWLFTREKIDEVVKEEFPVKNEIKEEKGMESSDALQIALDAAKKWQPDAELSRIDSGSVSEAGRSDIWRATFISSILKGKGYVVEVNNGKVVFEEEILYTGAGAEFTPELITEDEAISKVREIKGYENAEILGVEAIYDPEAKIWFWGVKTGIGVVSVKAER